MKICGIELEFDLFDADNAEVYEAAVEKVQKGLAETTEGTTLSVVIRHQCGLIFQFFDDVVGDGFHKELFGDKTNLMTCLDAFGAFVAAVNEQKAELDMRVNQYMPNRAARRAVHPKK